jgi:hypothetical protein
MKRKVRILASLGLFLVSAVVPPEALGGIQTIDSGDSIQSCSQAYVIIWENTGYNGDGLQICYGTNISNLANVPVLTGDHKCDPNPNGNWDNCTSAVQFSESSVNTTVCLYSEVNYIGQFWKGTNNGDHNSWIFPPNDWATSVKFGC